MMDDCAAYYMDCPYCTDKCVCMAAEEAQEAQEAEEAQEAQEAQEAEEAQEAQKSEPISEKKCSETDDALETGDAQHFTQTTTRCDR